MTKELLAEIIQDLDHYTQYSDDYSVVRRGIKQKEFILLGIILVMKKDFLKELIC